MSTLADTTPVLPRQPVWPNALVQSRSPEPVALFVLVIRVFQRHGPVTDGGPCDACAEPWPCQPALLAWRLREGF
jgi:hypothetical protein